MKILYNLASRSRPTELIKAIDNIISLAVHESYEIIVTLDLDDKSVTNDEFKSKIMSYGERVKPFWGISKSKVDAINKNVGLCNDWTILCNHSDDMVFLNQGFDLGIIEAFKNFNGLLHFPDGRLDRRPLEKHSIEFLQWVMSGFWTQASNNGKWVRGATNHESQNVCDTITDLYKLYLLELNKRLCTYPIMYVDYYKRFNYIYHPSYLSVYCDEEQMIVAKKLKLYKYVDKQIFRHEHYRNGYGFADSLMTYNDSPQMYTHDRAIYLERLTQNFGLNKIIA